MTRRASSSAVLVVSLLLGVVQCRPAPKEPGDVPLSTRDISRQAASELAGTSWRLVKFEGGDGTVLTPDDRSKYTLAFGADDRLSARIDCNRGMATWKSSAPTHLEFGPLALTRAICPPGSLHDRIVKHWEYVRSYVMQDGHLFLSLMADGGIYELEPTGAEESAQDPTRE